MSLPGSEGEHRLQREYGTESRAASFYERQMLHTLNARMREFIGRMEMLFVATSDAKGECDASFRAGLAGFVQVLNDRTLAWPEYRGNGVMASLGNISENPHVGLFFGDFFGSTVGLHVNGKARIVENSEMARLHESIEGLDALPEALRAGLAARGGRAPERWVVVQVQEAYIHCSKHLPKLQKLDKPLHWGTDDERAKGGDYFGTRNEPSGLEP